MFRVQNQLIPALLLATIPAFSQAVQSPVVNPDRSVTFTLAAPFADNAGARKALAQEKLFIHSKEKN